MDPALPSCAVLMATYNGLAFIDEQLATIAAQTSVGRIDMVVSDDGSTDGTLDKLHEWSRNWTRGAFQILRGPSRGFAENFRALLVAVETDADYIAFSDQDDIWDPDKLAAAIARLGPTGESRPAVYFSRTRTVDALGMATGFSPLFERPPGFRNALVQSIGGGNTTVLNRQGFALVAESARRTGFVTHDWWSYLVVSAAGGEVIYDPVPHIGYRQHGANLVGTNTGMGARLLRLRQLLKGRFAGWTTQNIAGLALCDDLIGTDARATLQAMADIRRSRGSAAVGRLRRAGLYRQTTAGNMGLVLAAFLGKL